MAKRLGDDVHQRFTEGRTQEQWLQYLYAKDGGERSALPAYEDLKRMGICKRKTRTATSSPIATSGAILKRIRSKPRPASEIYSADSQRLPPAGSWRKDEVISPLPVYASTFEGWDDPLRSQYPLQLFGFHYKARTHSSYGNVDVLQAACRQEVWIKPLDAEKRGIKNAAIWCAFF